MHTRRHWLQPGIACIWVACAVIVFAGIVGLACDTAYMMLTAHQLQNAADASALAGAQMVRLQRINPLLYDPRQAAMGVGAANRAAAAGVQLDLNAANAPDGDIVLGRYDRISHQFVAGAASANAVKVVARRTSDSLGGPVALLFGPMFSVPTANIHRPAVAMVGGTSGAAIIALDPHAPDSLSLGGNCTVRTGDGNIQVNSDNVNGASAKGNPTIQAPQVDVTGGIRQSGHPNFSDCELNRGAPPIPDPLADLPYPPIGADKGTVSITANENVSIQPGYYSGGLTMHNGSLTLAPGIYVLDGAGLNINGGTLTANGVMFFIKGDGGITLNGNGTETITAPTSGIYEGIAIFQARENDNAAKIVGTANMGITGTVYCAGAELGASGNSGNFCSQIIANTIDFSGNGSITVNYAEPPSSSANHAFLVE